MKDNQILSSTNNLNYQLCKRGLNMDNHEIKILIDKYLKLEEQHRNQLLLILVANVEGENSEYDDYKNTSVLSEYYTLEEFETLSTTYKKMGYEVLNYFSERDFMRDIIDNQIQINDKKLLVINSAQTGTYIGRKSLIPAFCDYSKIMHTGSNPYVVSLCRDKFHTNSILNNYFQNSLPTYVYAQNQKWIGGKRPIIGEKVIAKLNGESASIGLTESNVFVYSPKSDSYLYQLTNQYRQPVIVQPFIDGYEIELPIIIGKWKFALLAAGIKMNDSKLLGGKFLDYNTRFNHTYDFYNYDSFNKILSESIKRDAIKVAEILNIENFGRIDFRIDPKGNYYISDIATNPHITKDSSFSYIFNELGYSYSELLSAMIGVTLSKYLPLNRF